MIPFVIDGENGTERSYDIYSRLLKDRIIYLGDEVEPSTANVIVAQMLYLDSLDHKKDIYFYINSPGGRVTDGLAIYDTMQLVKADVQTICVGQALSMGSFLLSGGAKGKRFVLPHSTVMIHQVSGGAEGMVTDIEIRLKESKRLKNLLISILAKNSGQTFEKVHTDCERDYFMTAEEAVAYGLADKVLTKL
jgi:ATP-dependent Clp protease protease subunit